MTAIGVLLDDLGVRLVGRCFGVRRVAIKPVPCEVSCDCCAALAARCSASMLSPESPAMLPCRNRRVNVSYSALRSSSAPLPSAPRMANRRYSDFLAMPSSNTTIEATRKAPPTVFEDVIAFDAQRRLVQTQRIRHVVHGAAACGHVADAAHLAALERLCGVLVGAVHQGLLLAARRHANRHRAAAPVAQPPFELLVAGGFDRHDHLPRHRGDRREEIVAAGLVLPLVAPARGLRPRLRVDGGDGLRDADRVAHGGQHDRRIGRRVVYGIIPGTVGGVVISIR